MNLFNQITMLDYSRPLPERAKVRKSVGPYTWHPSEPGKGRGFYLASNGLACDARGSTFNLRLEWANDHLRGSRLATIDGYYCDAFQCQTMQPIVARLPHGRGFLAGYTMGNSMASSLDGYIWDSIEGAARAAHDMAERDAEKEREYQEQDQEEE